MNITNLLEKFILFISILLIFFILVSCRNANINDLKKFIEKDNLIWSDDEAFESMLSQYPNLLSDAIIEKKFGYIEDKNGNTVAWLYKVGDQNQNDWIYYQYNGFMESGGFLCKNKNLELSDILCSWENISSIKIKNKETIKEIYDAEVINNILICLNSKPFIDDVSKTDFYSTVDMSNNSHVWLCLAEFSYLSLYYELYTDSNGKVYLIPNMSDKVYYIGDTLKT